MKLRITIDGKVYEVDVEIVEPDESAPEYPEYPVAPPAFVPSAIAEPVIAPQLAEPGDNDKESRSPVTGMVIKVNVERGQTVQAGDVLVVLESMKMEMQISAPLAGVLKSVQVAQGSSVKVNQLLVEFE